MRLWQCLDSVFCALTPVVITVSEHSGWLKANAWSEQSTTNKKKDKEKTERFLKLVEKTYTSNNDCNKQNKIWSTPWPVPEVQ